MIQKKGNALVLSYAHFALVILIAIYFQLTWVRSAPFDILFGGIVFYYGYQICTAYYRGYEVIIQLDEMNVSRKQRSKLQYSVKNLRDLRSRKSDTCEDDWYCFQLENVSQSSLHATKAKRSVTPDYTRRLAAENVNRQNYRHSHFSLLSSMTRIDKEEHKAYNVIMDNLSEDMENIVAMLPKDPQHGKVIWFNGECGKIETVDPVLDMYEFCFQIRDCTLEDGEGVRLRVGDRVIFNLSISEQKLFAVNVARLAKRTLSSPDLCRLVLRQSMTGMEEVPPFAL